MSSLSKFKEIGILLYSGIKGYLKKKRKISGLQMMIEQLLLLKQI